MRRILGRMFPAFYERSGLNIELYPNRVWKHDIPFYVARAKAEGGKVLELGSGAGRVSIPIAEAGFEVCGLELSAAMQSEPTTEMFPFKAGMATRGPDPSPSLARY